MKRSFFQPSTSGESGKRSRLFSLQQALDLVYDSDEDEQDLADIYPESDLESDYCHQKEQGWNTG